MTRSWVILRVGAVILAIGAVGCGEPSQEGDAASDATASLAGKYNCMSVGGTEEEHWELLDDGTLSIEAPDHPVPGTWSLKDGSVTVTVDNRTSKFSVEGDRLVGAPGQPLTGREGFNCAPA